MDYMCQCGSLISYAPPRCRTSRYRRTFVPLSMSLWNDLADSAFDGVALADLKIRADAFFIGLSCSIPTTSSTIFPFLLFLSIGWYYGAGIFGLIGCISLSLSLALPPLLIIITIKLYVHHNNTGLVCSANNKCPLCRVA